MQYIKWLAVENFKSYRGYQVIGPFNNFTAIIGPNGAGKSNLIEAISFVFGVKTMNLRGSQLNDLFCKYANPNTDKCSVKVFFIKKTQVDEREYLFERRLNLSRGVSEFYIDGVCVSWTEYEGKLGLFNVLVKLKNFLVFQGDVENIARKSPKELTLLIEQISESIQYKDEYDRLSKEHSRAVENGKFLLTQQKSLKLERRQYRDQQKEVLQYNLIREQQKQLNQQYVICQLFYCWEEIESLKVRKSKKNSSLGEIMKKIQEGQMHLTEKKKKLSDQQLETSRLKRQYESMKSELFKVDPMAMAKERELVAVNRRMECNIEELERIRQFGNAQMEVISRLERELIELNDLEVQYLASEQKLIDEAGGITLTPVQEREWNELKEKANIQNASLHQALSQLENQGLMDSGSRKVLTMDLDNLKIRKDELMDLLGVLERRNEEIIRSIMELENEKTRNETILGELHAGNEKARVELNACNRELEVVQEYLKQAGIMSLEFSRRDRFDEYLESMKRLFSGVHGKMIDLVKPVASHYMVCLVVVLGSYLDAIVVSEKKVALDCIQYMKEHQVGVFTFLPLDSIESVSVDDSLRKLGFDSKPLIDVLVYDQQYQKAVEYVCGDTLLCRDLESARQLAFGRVKRKVVTLDGELITKNGLMSGGRSRAIEGKAKRWQESEIKEKKNRHDELQSQIAKYMATLRSTAREQDLQQGISQIVSKVNSLTFEQELTQRRMESIRGNIQDVLRSMERIEQELGELESKDVERQAKIQEINSRIKGTEDELFAPFAERVSIRDMREWERVQKSAERRKAERNVKFSYQRSRIENLLSYERQRLGSRKQEELEVKIASDRETRARLCEELDTLRASVNDLKKSVEGLKVEVDRCYPLNDKLELELLSLMKDMENRRILESGIKKVIDAIEGEIMNAMVRRHNIYLQCAEDEVELPILAGQEHLPRPEREFIAKDLSEMKRIFEDEDAIEVDFSQLPDQYKGRKNQAQIEELYSVFNNSLKAQSAKLDKMMPNMNAENYLVDLEHRIGEIDEKVIRARQEELALRISFDKVRSKRNQAFMEAFTCISNNINGIYKQLTNEFGVAHLVVDSNDEPYLHSVRYTAVPRHKTFRNIDDLSGGEKSVAALALLFAIHSYRPSPFFILDEVDASLDRNNVKIIVKYIQKASMHTQFLIISLKEICYEKAESLVGVYIDRMNPPKTSKALSLDLSKYEEA